MPERTDNELIEAYLKGDEASLAVLFRRHARGDYAYAARLIGETDADDAAQEAFVRAWKHLKRFDRTRPFKPWLYRIAHNAALDLLKKRRPIAFTELQKNDETPPVEEWAEDPLPPISETFDRNLEADRLRQALDALPAKHRLVIELHETEDLTFAEIGLTLDEPLNTVKSRYRRALLELRRWLEPKTHQNPSSDRTKNETV